MINKDDVELLEIFTGEVEKYLVGNVDSVIFEYDDVMGYDECRCHIVWHGEKYQVDLVVAEDDNEVKMCFLGDYHYSSVIEPSKIWYCLAEMQRYIYEQRMLMIKEGVLRIEKAL